MESQVNSVNSSEIDQTAQQALKAMQARFEQIKEEYDELQQWTQQMKDDVAQISADEQALLTKIYDHHDLWILFIHLHWTTVNHALENQLNNDIASKNADIADLKGKCAAVEQDLTGSSSGSNDIISAIQSLLQGMDTVRKDTDESVAGSADRFKQDVKQITQYLDSLFKALTAQIEVAKLEAMINARMKNLSGDDGDTSKLEALAQQMMGLMYQEQTDLNAVSSAMEKDSQVYHQQKNDADTDKNGIHWWDEWFSDGCEREDKDDAIMRNSADMMHLLSKIQDMIAPEIASLTPDFQALNVTLETIVKKVLKILQDTKLSGAEKQTQIMSLFVIVMGLLGLVQQFSAKEKAQNEQRMSQASVDSAQSNISDSQMQQKKLQQDLDYAAIMGKIMKVAQIVGGALMTLLAPGIGSALLMGLLTVLEATGVMDKLAEAMGGGIGGDLAVSGIELVLTCGGGAALDAAMKAAMKTAMRTVETAMEEVVDTVVQQSVEKIGNALKAAGKQVTQEAEKSAEQEVTKAVQAAIKTAANKTFKLYFEQNGMSLIYKLLKEAASGGAKNAAARLAEQTMKDVAETAAKNTADQMTKMMSSVLEKMEAFTEKEVQDFGKLAEDAANEAVGKISGQTTKDAAKVSVEDSWGSTAKTAVKRAGWTALYATGSNKLLTDGLLPAISDDASDTTKMIVNLIQQLLMLIAQIGGSGVMSQITMEGAPATFMKIANLLQVVPQAGDIVSSVGEATASYAESDVVKAIAAREAASDVINFLESEIVKRQQKEAKYDSDQASRQFSSTNALASNLWRSYDSACMVMG